MSSIDLFTRLTSTHKPDCILSLHGPAPEAVPDPEQMARALGSEAVSVYATACRPIYEDMRRIIGQLAGLLILARLTERPEMADLTEMKSCQSRWQDAAQRLGTLVAPPGLDRHKLQLESAHAFSGRVMGTFPELRAGNVNGAQLDRMSVQIKRAYAHLNAASSVKASLQMVDFSQACCSCDALVAAR
ncbi:MAG: hypothetical protein HY834_19940 [Devosia nanyangense]|uniref:Uncharacterized protein n=1 Tax=Devosia nanyangense TaxID=1228055 RepID=A0A933L7X3_9HYPH|nr:hypothetical protein [Devosia nanyangense]